MTILASGLDARVRVAAFTALSIAAGVVKRDVTAPGVDGTVA
jgi:hypothetical protein